MSNVPAWKRIGLKVKQDEEEDRLVITTQLATAEVTNKQIKKINKKNKGLKDANAKEDGEKKAPKRVKVPKSERGEGPEKDQLAYLVQFQNDKDNWKFSKQKQNWIVRHIRQIPEKYESALLVYLEGMKGIGRDRIVDDCKLAIKRWNELADIAERKIEEELQNKLKSALKQKTDDDQDSDDEIDEEERKKIQARLERLAKLNAKDEDKEKEPDYDYAIRCRNLVFALTDEKLELKGIHEDPEEEETEEIATTNEPSVSEDTKAVTSEEPESLKEDASESESTKDNVILEEVNVDEFSLTKDSSSKRSSTEQGNQKTKKSKKSKKSKKTKAEKESS